MRVPKERKSGVLLGLFVLLMLVPFASAAPTFTKIANPATLPAGIGADLDYSPDDGFLAVGHFVSPFVSVYSVSGETYTKLSNPATLPTGDVQAVDWDATSSYLAVGNGGATPFVVVYSRSGSTLTKMSDLPNLPSSVVHAVRWSPDGSLLAVGSQGTPTLTIYQKSGTTFTKMADPAYMPASTVYDIAWSSDGAYLAVSFHVSPYVVIYSVSGTTLTKLTDPATLPTGIARGVAFSPDTTLLAVTHDTAPRLTIYQRSGSTFTKLANPANLPPGEATGVDWSPDGSLLTVGHLTTPFVTNYERTGTTFTKLANPASLPTSTVRGIDYLSGGSYVAITSDATPFLAIYNVDPPATAYVAPSVSGVVARAGNASVYLNWTGHALADYYVIGRDTAPHPGVTDLSQYSAVINASTATSYVDTGLTNGVTYYYRVRPVDVSAGFAGDVSAEVNATPWSAPTLVANTGARTAVLSWDAGGWVDPTNFTIYKGAQSGNLSLYRTLLGAQRGYNDELAPGTTAYYVVRVSNATNTSAFSNEVRVVMPSFFEWGGNLTRVVPDQVTVFINRTFQETYWIDLVRFDNDGNPRSVMTASQWNETAPANFTFRWPQFRASNTSLDVGTYHVFVTDGNGTYLDGRFFCIGQFWSVGAANLTQCLTLFSLDDGARSQLAVDSASEAAAIRAALALAVQEATVQDYVFTALGWFLGSPFGEGTPPVMVLLDLGALVVFIVSIIVYSRGR